MTVNEIGSIISFKTEFIYIFTLKWKRLITDSLVDWRSLFANILQFLQTNSLVSIKCSFIQENMKQTTTLQSEHKTFVFCCNVEKCPNFQPHLHNKKTVKHLLTSFFLSLNHNNTEHIKYVCFCHRTDGSNILIVSTYRCNSRNRLKIT